MSLPLPNLDDRRWADLVEEGRSLIPLYAPLWTDHNLHDPGITLMELFAWIAEMDIYQLNRIPEQHLRKFLALVGIQPEPPHPARTVLSFQLSEEAPLSLPSTVEFEAIDPLGQRIQFRTLQAVTIVPGQIQAVQIKTSTGFQDVSQRWRRGETFGAFGDDPKPDTALYLGFTQPLPPQQPISLQFTLWDLVAGEEQRRTLIRQVNQQSRVCQVPSVLIRCQNEPFTPPPEAEPEGEKLPPHPSVRTVWEFLTTGSRWQPLSPTGGQVEDDTRSFTVNGRVQVTLPQAILQKRLGAVESELYYLRCRLVGGTYDASPMVQNLAMNAVIAEQAVPVTTPFAIAPNAVVEGTAPAPENPVSLEMQLTVEEEISQLRFVPIRADLPSFKLLEFHPAQSNTRGKLSLEAVLLGIATGQPLKQIRLQTAIVPATFQLFTLERMGNQTMWRSWQLRDDLDASGRNDTHFLLNVAEGIVSFGDGETGRVPPAGALIMAQYHTTYAQKGNVDRDIIHRLADSLHNQALLPEAVFNRVKQQLIITNPLPAVGGTTAETIFQAASRALTLREAPQRAVTLSDYETLAMQTPGTQLARVAARANLHPGFPCFNAPGIITLIILPYLPLARPMPSRALKQAVSAYLAPRRVIGTQVIVVGPIYVEVAVRANVQAVRGTNLAALQQTIATTLNQFFHPLTGGSDSQGWPFGRDVYRSEVLQVMDGIPGVDHVLSLELLTAGGKPQCSNICLGPMGLVAAGQHTITVV